jgi:SagB-type dehydrogenase family enzyme
MSGGIVNAYHDATKHHFHRFARSVGYLDWASQPCPFRSFRDASSQTLPPVPGASPPAGRPDRASFDALYVPNASGAAPLTVEALGDMLRHALGLSAWKQTPYERWSLRVNPSSGNLHPTEAYLIAGAVSGIGGGAGVFHYAPERHALERRCTFDPNGWREACGAADPLQVFLVALTSIHWREAWKYGERAFRYCQHDLGHAIAALRLAASLHAWRMRLEAEWPHRALAALVGIDRDEDYEDAEREEPGCVLAVACGASAFPSTRGRSALLDATRAGVWHGRAGRLSAEHVDWARIDEVAAATENPGRPDVGTIDPLHAADPAASRSVLEPRSPAGGELHGFAVVANRGLDARGLILRRRSALDFDGQSSIESTAFLQMLARTIPGPHPPWDALW